MKTKHKFVIVVTMIVLVLGVLSAAAGDMPAELEEYSTIQVALGLFWITSVFWAPLALVLLFLPGPPR